MTAIPVIWTVCSPIDDIDEILDDTHNGVNDSEDISVTGIVASYLSCNHGHMIM